VREISLFLSNLIIIIDDDDLSKKYIYRVNLEKSYSHKFKSKADSKSNKANEREQINNLLKCI